MKTDKLKGHTKVKGHNRSQCNSPEEIVGKYMVKTDKGHKKVKGHTTGHNDSPENWCCSMGGEVVVTSLSRELPAERKQEWFAPVRTGLHRLELVCSS